MKKMTRVVAATNTDKARKILKAGKDLLNLLEETPEGFLKDNDLQQLYDELIEVLPALDFAINDGSIE